MDVFVANEQTVPVDEFRLSALARHTLESEGVETGSELSVLLVTPGHMRRLNKRFAGDDHATDVLAFPMMEDDEDDASLLLGDIVVCPEVADKNATEYGRSLSEEIETLVVHGTLHLLGYDHQNEEERTAMDARTREIISDFRLP